MKSTCAYTAIDESRAAMPSVGGHQGQSVSAASPCGVRRPDEALARELLLMTDRYTVELFDISPGNALRFPLSRLVVDPGDYALSAAL